MELWTRYSQPQDSVQKATTGMNVSFISFYEITPSFNSVELVSSRHRNGGRNENAVFANRDKYGHGFACTGNVYVQRVTKRLLRYISVSLKGLTGRRNLICKQKYHCSTLTSFNVSTLLTFFLITSFAGCKTAFGRRISVKACLRST